MFENLQRPPMADAPLSVVLVASDQRDAEIESALRGWCDFLDSHKRDYEVLVTGGERPDQGLESVRAVATRYPRVTFPPHASRSGFGAALRTGLADAKHPLLFYTDCSCSYKPSDLQSLLDAIDHSDLVSGYRVNERGRRLRGNDFLFRLLARWLFGVRLKDAECSFKLFRRDIFCRIPVQSDGIFAHAEILAKANFLGCMMTEVPVSYQQTGPTARSPELRRQRKAEAYTVFFHPDFGPAILPEGIPDRANAQTLSPPSQSVNESLAERLES
jgi:hypothetical protein